MSSKNVGFLRHMWTTFKKSLVIYRTKDVYVGSDEFGNKYYEREHDEQKELKRQRKIVPLSEDQSEVPTVPVEWMTWLQGRRQDAPSEEEIMKNKEEALRVLARVANLKDNSEKKTEELSPSQKAILSSKFPIRPEYEKIPGTHDK